MANETNFRFLQPLPNWPIQIYNFSKEFDNQFFFVLSIQIHLQDNVADSLHPEVLTIYGNWLAETCSDSPNVIIEQYMEKVQNFTKITITIKWNATD